MYIVRCAQSRTALAAPSKNGMKNWMALARAKGAALGEEAVLADSGREGDIAARVRRVRSPAFLSRLRGSLNESGTFRRPCHFIHSGSVQQPVKATHQKCLYLPA